jgi:hypothetical protein
MEAEQALAKVKKLNHINRLQRKYPDWLSSVDKTMFSDSLRFPNVINAKRGEIVLKQYCAECPQLVLKVIKIENVELCKLKYIYINGSEYSRTKIDSLRKVIIKRYKNGEDFVTLVKEYTMDNNPTGDLGWFYRGMMVDKFDRAVRPRSKGEIFKVDVKNNKWYYVVLKTHDNKMEKAVVSIMISCATAEK